MNNILAGLQIISKYSPKGSFSSAHDQIWAGEGYDKDVTNMSVGDRKRMELDLGWFVDEKYNCWSHFC